MKKLIPLILVMLAGLLLGATGCGLDTVPLPEERSGGESTNAYSDGDGDTGGTWDPPCGGGCPAGFHCEFDTCMPDAPPIQPPGAARDPLTSNRYVFSLEVEQRRLLRIDSVTLEVEAYTAGLAPMALAVVGSRELTVLLDGYDLVEVFDHRQEPPVRAAWVTAIDVSHLALSPTGEHVVIYYDCDDPRAAERQPGAANLNQVSVLYLGDGETPFDDGDPRIVKVAVGFKPRDVRFSADGTRAVVIGKDTLTPIVLGSPFEPDGSLAEPEPQIFFDESALEILVDADASLAAMRYAEASVVHIIDMVNGAVSCFDAVDPVTDFDFAKDGRLITVAGAGTIGIAVTPLASALPDPCLVLTPQVNVTDAGRIAVDPSGDYAVAYEPTLAIETIWRVDLGALEAQVINLEKAVGAVAFAGDGRHLLLSHLKKEGEPLWDPSLEDFDESVDKAYGVTWVNLDTTAQRLAVSSYPFGSFTFVPPSAERPGATYQAVQDERAPRLMRVTHEVGFDDLRLELAAMPLKLGYLPETGFSFVTQDHPWGRVTFIDASGEELRHVTGFAMELNP